MKTHLFMKKVASFLLISSFISNTVLPAAATPTQLTQLNANKRGLKSSIADVINCLKEFRSCDAEMKKTIQHISIILGILSAITVAGIGFSIAYKAGLLPDRELIAYKLFIRTKGYDEKYEEEFRQLENALENDEIDQLKDAIKNGALYYPDSKFSLFKARSTDAVYYLIANYPYNRDELLNAQKSFPVAGMVSATIILSPLKHHQSISPSRDIERILIRFGAQEVSKPVTQ